MTSSPTFEEPAMPPVPTSQEWGAISPDEIDDAMHVTFDGLNLMAGSMTRTHSEASPVIPFPDRHAAVIRELGDGSLISSMDDSYPDAPNVVILPTLPEVATRREKYQLGTVAKVEEVAPRKYGLVAEKAPRAVYEVAVNDPYVEKYSPETRAEVARLELQASEGARLRREAGAWQRKPGRAYVDVNNEERAKHVWGDPVSTNAFFSGTVDSEALRVWRKDIVPSALALAYLADPQDVQTVYSKKQKAELPIDEDARKWWTLCTDAVAIRSRGTVMAELVNGYVDGYVANGGSSSDLRWASIACGTALPSMKAAVRSNIAPELTLIDFDDDAMEATKTLADEVGFDGQIDKKPMDIFNPDAMSKLRDELAAEDRLPQIVDMMGIFEYTGNNLGIDPVPFMKSGYDLVAPGGTLIFGQMRQDRPVADFTNGVVAWPYVEQRSPKDLMDMIVAAGIPAECVRLYMPTDGVYTVVAVDKPDK